MLFGAGLALLQAAIELVGHPLGSSGITMTSFGTAAILLCSYVRHFRRANQPIINLDLLSIRSFRTGVLSGGLSRIGINGIPYLLPLLLQIGLGRSAVESGVLTAFASVGMVMVRPYAAYLLRRYGFSGLLTMNAVLGAVSIAAFAGLETDSPDSLILLLILAFSMMRGLHFTTINTLNYADMPAEQLSAATSFGGVAQQVAMGIGISVSAALLAHNARDSTHLVASDFPPVFLGLALIVLASAYGFARLHHHVGARVIGGSTPDKTIDG
jgi:hypothetical protein